MYGVCMYVCVYVCVRERDTYICVCMVCVYVCVREREYM